MYKKYMKKKKIIYNVKLTLKTCAVKKKGFSWWKFYVFCD